MSAREQDMGGSGMYVTDVQIVHPYLFVQMHELWMFRKQLKVEKTILSVKNEKKGVCMIIN